MKITTVVCPGILSRGKAHSVLRASLSLAAALSLSSTLCAADALRVLETYSQPAASSPVSASGKTSLTITVPLTGIDIASFNTATSIDLSIGSFDYTGALGNDPAYRLGKRSATLFVRTPGMGRPGPVTASKATFAWNARLLSISIAAATPLVYQPVLAASLGVPGRVGTSLPASLVFGPLHDDFAVRMTGRVAVRSGVTQVSLQGEGVPVSTARRVGTGSFHVDVTTGDVIVGNSTSSASTASVAGGFQPSVILAGNSVIFNSSQLLDYAGDTGEQLLNVSFTNQTGETIGQSPDGVVTGERVLFTPFLPTGSDTTLSSQAIVTTFAGLASLGATVPVVFDYPSDIAIGPDGAVYVVSLDDGVIVKITPTGLTSVLANFGEASAIAINPVDGALIVATEAAIYRIDVNGSISKILSVSAAFFNGAAVNSQGVIYLIEEHSIASLTLTPGSNPALAKSYTLSTLAGNRTTHGYMDGNGSAARFDLPFGLTVDDSTGVIYVADTGNNRVRRISPEGAVTTVAGTGSGGETDGAGNVATFRSPSGVAVINGVVLVSDEDGNTVRLMTPSVGADPTVAANWQVATLAGTGSAGHANGAGNVATFSEPIGLATDGNQNLYVADYNSNAVRLISFPFTLVPGGVSGTTASVTSGFTVAPPVQLANPTGLIPNQAAGADLPYIFYPGPLATGSATAPQPWNFVIPAGVTAFDFTASVETNTGAFAPPSAVLNSNTDNIVSPAAGAGGGSPSMSVRTLAGGAGDGFLNGSAAEATFDSPVACTVDNAGNVYVSDNGNNAIRRIGPAGLVSTVAGVQSASSVATDGSGNIATFNSPYGIAVSPDGLVIFVADSGNDEIRRIAFTAGDLTDPANWTVTTIAGSPSPSAYVDGTTGDKATFSKPVGLARDAAGNLFVTENTGNRVRMLQYQGGDPSINTHWYVSRVAGDASALAGSSGTTDGSGAIALFHAPFGIAVDGAGNLYVVDQSNNRIRKITNPGLATASTVSTDAGPDGSAAPSGYADGTGSTALFASPSGVAIDSSGYCYVSDNGNYRIRRISPAGAVETVAGTGTDGTQDGTGDIATFSAPMELAVDPGGAIYVPDIYSIRIIEPIFTLGTP